MQMDYFRRPKLAGNNITRTNRATIRGSLRRTDANGSSTVPYFPTAVAGQDIWVSVDGAVATTVTLTDPNVAGTGIVAAIADLNTALNPGAEAFDSDGTISIRSAGATGAASIEVVGGSASAALGFDTSLGTIRAVYGEEFSTPEGRLGNPFGTAFPNKNENLSVESVNRALARLTSNADVLYSEHMRADALPKKIGFTTSDNVILTPTTPDAIRVFNGLGTLNNATSKEILARFFFLVDQATGLPPASRVIGVGRGAISFGPPPISVYFPLANATTWTGGGATGNILGVDLTKSSLAITSISNGRVIKCTGGAFISVGKVVPGDYVQITGATNITPWDNNGYRWVVEEVITEETIAVRPMSSSELAQFGPVTTEERPILELNSKKTGGEIYGTCVIKTGTYCNDVKVIVDPPIPTGCTYDLYVATPGDLRSRKTHEEQYKEVLNSFSASDLRPEPNAVLVAPLAHSPTLASFTLNGGYGRFSGRVVSIPGRTVLATEFAVGTSYLYWDQDTNEVKITQSPVKVFNSDPTLSPGSAFPGDTQASQWLIATVTKAGANITNLEPASRQLAEEGDAHVVTIGVGGQFSNLTTAAEFINRWSSQNGGRANTYHQFEIVFLNDYDLNSEVITFVPSVRLRGARPDIKINCTSYAGVPFTFGTGAANTFIMEDVFFTFDASFASSGALFDAGANSTVVLRNLQSDTTDSFGGIFGSFLGRTAIIDTCRLFGVKSIVATGAISASFEIFNSKFEMTAGLVGVQVLFGQVGTPLDYTRLVVRDCDFTKMNTQAVYSNEALMGTFVNPALFDGCIFSKNVANPPVSNSVLFKKNGSPVGGHLVISNCTAHAPTRCFIDAPIDTNFCIIENCDIHVEPDGIDPGIRAPVVRHCTIFGSGGSGQVLVEATRECHGNFITGDSVIGIRNGELGYPYVNISNNRVAVNGGVSIQAASYNTSPPAYEMMVNVSDNQILVTGASAIGIQTYAAAPANLTNGCVKGNQIQLDMGDVGNNNKIGIDVKGTPLVEGNTISLFNTGATTGHVGIKVTHETSPGTVGINLPKIIGNTVTFDSNSFDCLTLQNSPSCIVMANHLLTPGAALAWRGTTTGNIYCYVQNNYLDGSVVNLMAEYFIGNVVLGNVSSVGYVGVISDCYFNGSSVVIQGRTERFLRVERCTFNDDPSFFGGYVDISQCIFQQGIYFSSGGSVRDCRFYGATAITISGVDGLGELLVEGNTFEGNWAPWIFGFPATVCRNQFISAIGPAIIGDAVGFPVPSTQFHDNYCTSSMDIQSSTTHYVDVSRNWFTSDVFTGEVDRLDNNYFVDGDLNIQGRIAGLGSPGPVSASGNTITGDGSRTFIRLAFSGLNYHSSSGTTYISDCSISSSRINVSSQTLFEFYNSQVSSTLFSLSGSLTLWGNIQMDGVTFDGAMSLTFADGSLNTFNNIKATSNFFFQSDGANSAVVDLTVSNSTIASHLSAVLVDGGNITFANNTCNQMTAALGQNGGGGTVIANGNRVRNLATSIFCNYGEIVGNDFGGAVTIAESAGIPPNAMHVLFAHNKVAGALTTTTEKTSVVGNVIFGDVTHSRTVAGSYYTFDGNQAGGSLNLFFDTAMIEKVAVTKNVFTGTITTFFVRAVHILFSENEVTPSTSVSVQLQANTRIIARDNRIATTSGVQADKEAMSLRLFSAVEEIITGNQVKGRVEVNQGGDVNILTFSDNTVESETQNHAVRIGRIGGTSIFGAGVISGNTIRANMTNTPVAQAWSPLYFGDGAVSGTSRVKIAHNHFELTLNPSGTGTYEKGVLEAPHMTISNIILIGNTIYRPSNNSGRNWHHIYFITSASSVLVTGNLMFTGGVLAAAGAGRRGEFVFPVPTDGGTVDIS